MNERIKELIRQAWKEAYNVDPADPRIARAHKAMEEGMEKFAQLIAKDCAKMLDEDSYIMPELGGYAHDIRTRYGVNDE
jgi:hypothetical protein